MYVFCCRRPFHRASSRRSEVLADSSRDAGAGIASGRPQCGRGGLCPIFIFAAVLPLRKRGRAPGRPAPAVCRGRSCPLPAARAHAQPRLAASTTENKSLLRRVCEPALRRLLACTRPAGRSPLPVSLVPPSPAACAPKGYIFLLPAARAHYRCQISPAYSRMVRSLEKKPERAVLRAERSQKAARSPCNRTRFPHASR